MQVKTVEKQAVESRGGKRRFSAAQKRVSLPSVPSIGANKRLREGAGGNERGRRRGSGTHLRPSE
jgi:hypothetical protein